MQLSWSDQAGIAKALLKTYPEQDRLALTLEDLRVLVVSLPCFRGPETPPSAALLRSILWTWMRFADGERSMA